MEPLSKEFYLGNFVGAFIGSFIIGFGAGLLLAFGNYVMFFLLIFIALCFSLFSLILFLILVHKMWKAIQEDSSRTSPGKGAGFLLIPFFNLYWAFIAIWGWTKDYNRYISERSIDVPRMPEGLSLTVCILSIAQIIPYIGNLIIIINFVIIVIFMNYAINGVNALIKSAIDSQ